MDDKKPKIEIVFEVVKPPLTLEEQVADHERRLKVLEDN